MKICFCMYPINQLGGIINHTEQLAWGLRELGHEVEYREFHNRKEVKRRTFRVRNELEMGAFGVAVCQHRGWEAMHYQRVAYGRDFEFLRWQKDAKEFDLIIWILPVPTANKEQKGNDRWPGLYEVGTHQIAMLHDGNFLARTPHILHVRGYIKGFIPVHDAADNSLKTSGLVHEHIPNPFPPRPPGIQPYGSRLTGFLAPQVFKKWKRVINIVRAIPHMRFSHVRKRYIAGQGLEYNYMATATDKMKPEYVAPDGKPYWEHALEADLEFLDVISNETRDRYLNEVRTLVDASWSVNNENLGAVYNRVTAEAIRMGAIPVAVRQSMNSRYYKEMRNFIPIDKNADDEDFARAVEYANNLSTPAATAIIEDNNWLFDEYFERKKVAQKVLDFAEKTKHLKHEEPSADLETASELKLEHFNL